MSAEGGLTTTGYIQHHLTNLTVCSSAARDAAGHCHGFWSFHLDTLVISGLLGIIVFGLMAIGSFLSGSLLSAYGWDTVLWVSFVPLALAVAALAVTMNKQSPPLAE